MNRKNECATTINNTACDVISPFDYEDMHREILSKCEHKYLQKTAQVSHLWKTLSIEIYKKDCTFDLENYVVSLKSKLVDPETFLKKVGNFDGPLSENFFSKCVSLNQLFLNHLEIREKFVENLSKVFIADKFVKNFWKAPWNWNNFYEKECLYNISYYELYLYGIEEIDKDGWNYPGELLKDDLLNKAMIEIDEMSDNLCNAEMHRYLKKLSKRRNLSYLKDDAL